MQKSIQRLIDEKRERFSPSDQVIADFFVNNTKFVDFGADSLARRLFVSTSALSRFAQRVGFSGYREFVFAYENELDGRIKHHLYNALFTRVFDMYQKLEDQGLELVDEAQINRIVELLSQANRVNTYGVGTSGLSASEFALRFMRIGLPVQSLTDVHEMNMNDVLVKEGTLVVAFSITAIPMLKHIRRLKQHGATIILLTTADVPEVTKYVDELVLCSSTKKLDIGNVVSPQLPLLLMTDLIYASYLARDSDYKTNLLEDTLVYIRERETNSRPK